ncbi:calcium:proton antiporter [Zhihengliuella sp.]|uniref:calcium:proton antiporter n=1 Tax=Zhihengliuella sp. TaxID=1954483 RepID=UPI0028114DD5|nr:calcium:proton antiporter [Zhihengliuella sp.]
MASTLHTVLTAPALASLGLGWAAYAATLLAHPLLEGPLAAPPLVSVLVAIVLVIVVCAFGVVAQAEHLAHRLGDPYGTLVLTLSIVLIEVILISAIMLGPGEHATIARDSVMAVSMIILNLVVGAALLVGGLRHGGLRANTTGVSAYLSVLVVLTAVAFAVPGLIGRDGAYTPGQAVPIAAVTVVLYAFFLHRQMGAQRADFQEPGPAGDGPTAVPPSEGTTAGGPGTHGSVATVSSATPTSMASVLAEHRTELLARTAVLVLTVVPIVLLSHDMAALLDEVLYRAGAPVALSGLLIALIVFLPETITTLRAAQSAEMQRVSNLCHGALVSTVGLTIPAVLVIGLLTGQTVTLAESPTNLVLLGTSLLLTVATFSGQRATALHGASHLLLFVVYGLTVFA